MTEFNTIGILFDIFLFLTCLIKLYPAINHKSVSSFNIKLCTIFTLLFFLFPFYGGDYYHYLEYYTRALSDPHLNSSLEEIYSTIANNTFGSYTLFRFIIWGSSLFLIIKTANGLGLPKPIFLLVLSCCFITVLAYARVTLTMALIFYGTYILTTKKNVLSMIVGIAIICVSFFFHKSALFGIAMAFCVLICQRIGRASYIIFLLSIPLIISILTYFISDFLQTSIAMEYINIDSAQGYLSSERSEKGIGALILNFLQRAPYYCLSLIFILLVVKNKLSLLPKRLQVFGSLTFLITITSSLYLIDLGMNTFVLYYRFLTFAAIPSAIFLSALRDYKLYNKLTALSFYMLVGSTAYSLLYTCYLSII